MPKIPLVGEFFTLRNPAAGAQQSLNVMPEFFDDPNEQGKNKGHLRLCPGYHAMATFPTSPIRGLWSGGGRLFVYAGTSLYEVTQGSYVGGNPSTGSGSVTLLSALGVHDGLPVMMFGNGNQLMLITNGQAYIDDGSGLLPIQFQIGGFVNTSGTLVNWVSGDDFTTALNGSTITINGVNYAISTVNSNTSITLGSTAGVQTNVPFSGALGTNVTALTGGYLDGYFIVQRPQGPQYSYNVSTSGQTVTSNSGNIFESISPGQGIAIGGNGLTGTTGYVVSSVTSATVLVLTTSAGAQTGVTASWGADLGRQFNISAPFDGTSWDPLDFASKEASPDYIQSILTDREQLLLFGTEGLEAWQNIGDPTFPFQRIPGAAARHGSVARFGPVWTGERVYFLGGSPLGPPVAYRLDGFTPVRVSTHAVEAAWANTTDQPRLAAAYSSVEDGHRLWVINFAGALNTWVYDETESERVGSPMWHQRASWNGSAFGSYVPSLHTFVPEWGLYGMHIVATYNPLGTDTHIYELRSDYPDANGSDTAWQRILPAIYSAGKWQFFGRMTLEMATGTSTSVTPQITRDYSDDRGNTFVNPVQQSVGAPGAVSQRVFWGGTSASRDRIFRLSGTGQYTVTLVDLDVDFEVGNT